jgi:hypothetical protein
VYAFQCRDYPRPSNENQSREKVLQLRELLSNLERRKILQNFDVFDGYLEEVVLRGYDNSPDRKEFLQYDTITVYNLDFCNQVTSPIEYTNDRGNIVKAYKFNAIQRLLDMQRNLPFPNQKFVLFLTVHCSYSGEEFTNFLNHPPNIEIKNYLKTVEGLTVAEKAPYLVKAFVYNSLQQFFTTNNFLPEFLPVIHYTGDNQHPLLFFTVLGTQVPISGGVPTTPQKISDFLNRKFLSISENDNIFANNIDLVAHGEKDWTAINPIGLFKATKIYNNFWRE